jgi:predicted metalloprotease with PDZ domain
MRREFKTYVTTPTPSNHTIVIRAETAFKFLKELEKELPALIPGSRVIIDVFEIPGN